MGLAVLTRCLLDNLADLFLGDSPAYDCFGNGAPACYIGHRMGWSNWPMMAATGLCDPLTPTSKASEPL